MVGETLHGPTRVKRGLCSREKSPVGTMHLIINSLDTRRDRCLTGFVKRAEKAYGMAEGFVAKAVWRMMAWEWKKGYRE